MTTQGQLALPIPGMDNEEFWRRVRQHELVLQHCKDCGAYTHPPAPTCTSCASPNREWVKASGKGEVHTYVTTVQAVFAAIQGRVPWTVVDVQLEEGVHIISNMVDCPPEMLKIGLPVEVVFEDVTPEATLYKFRPRK
ncbi:MAG: OB-fold domain-containing protein [Chloroflexi bacterium]|nr:OB-fold domain-containing protein [Chloroflexota bacterium]